MSLLKALRTKHWQSKGRFPKSIRYIGRLIGYTETPWLAVRFKVIITVFTCRHRSQIHYVICATWHRRWQWRIRISRVNSCCGRSRANFFWVVSQKYKNILKCFFTSNKTLEIILEIAYENDDVISISFLAKVLLRWKKKPDTDASLSQNWYNLTRRSALDRQSWVLNFSNAAWNSAST